MRASEFNLGEDARLHMTTSDRIRCDGCHESFHVDDLEYYEPTNSYYCSPCYAMELADNDVDEHANLIAQDGWEDDGERGRR